MSVPLAIEIQENRLKHTPGWSEGNIHLCGAHACLANSAERVIVTIHDYYGRSFVSEAKTSPARLANEFLNAWLRRTAARRLSSAMAIVTPSTFSANQLEHALGLRSTVIHHWTDEVRFHERPQHFVRRELGLPYDKRLVLSVGGSTSNKGLEVLREVAKLLPTNYSIVRVGTPVYISGVRVINMGTLSAHNYPLIFNACDAYLHTSTVEGFGYPLLESMTSGLPVVARSISTVPEVIGASPAVIHEDAPLERLTETITGLEDDRFRENVVSYQRCRALLFSEARAREAYARLYSSHFK